MRKTPQKNGTCRRRLFFLCLFWEAQQERAHSLFFLLKKNYKMSNRHNGRDLLGDLRLFFRLWTAAIDGRARNQSAHAQEMKKTQEKRQAIGARCQKKDFATRSTAASPTDQTNWAVVVCSR
nr:hypothetical protein [Pandoravirus aubagnensis]